jgi:hypothetical protein
MCRFHRRPRRVPHPAAHRPSRVSRRRYPLAVETLEGHLLLSPIIVSTTADNGSNTSPTPGSLRAAILAANKQPGATIDFLIGSGAQTIQPPVNLPTITAPVTIDGTSQPGYAGTPLITIDGTNDGSSNGIGLSLGTGSSGSTVKGLAILDFKVGLQVTSAHNTIGGTAAGAGNLVSGNTSMGLKISGAGATGNTVEGNFIGTNAAGNAAVPNGIGVQVQSGATDNVIGGTAAGAGNLVSGNGYGIKIVGAGTMGNLVEGNFVGTNAAGNAAVPTKWDGIVIGSGASGNTIGGTATGAGNLVSGNNNYGVNIWSNDNLVEGNRIGTTADGTAAVPNRLNGVFVWDGASDNTIGGTAPGAGNLISGNGGNGIEITDQGADNVVAGNRIGTTADGTAALPNNGPAGIYIHKGSSNNTVGGTATGAGNVIAYNHGVGVIIGSSASDACANDAILGNAIFANGKLGIDLGNNGVTLNDSSGHTGPNLFQNFPVLSTAVSSGGSTTITGTLTSTANTSFRVELFANITADPSGYGEGQTYLGFVTVTTNASGQGSFRFTVNQDLGNQWISATATDPNGDTSEFAQDFVVSTS